MKAKVKIVLCLLTVLLTFTSCDVFTDTKNLLRPPNATGELAKIEEALYQKVGSNIRFAFPASGSYRSSYVSKDLDGDGENEAIVFYTETVDSAVTHMNVLDKTGDDWEIVQDITAPGTGVDSIDFSDLTGDGIIEIIISWSYNTRVKTLNVYSYDEKTSSFVPKMTEDHTGYTVCNLSGMQNELLLLNVGDTTKIETDSSANIALSISEVKLYKFEKDKPVLVGRTPLNGGGMSVASIKAAPVNDLLNGIYIDSAATANSMTTDLICYENGKLVDKFYNGSEPTNETLREGTTLSRDIDKDGFIEIPMNVLMPGYENSSAQEKQYFSRMRRYDGKFFQFLYLSYISEDLGYYLKVDDSWLGNVTVVKNKEERTDVYHEWNVSKGKAEQELFRVSVFNEEGWAAAKEEGYTLLAYTGKQYYGAKITAERNKYLRSIDKLKESFNRIG